MLYSLQNLFTQVVSFNFHNILLGSRYFHVPHISLDVLRDGVPYLPSRGSHMESQDSKLRYLGYTAARIQATPHLRNSSSIKVTKSQLPER